MLLVTLRFQHFSICLSLSLFSLGCCTRRWCNGSLEVPWVVDGKAVTEANTAQSKVANVAYTSTVIGIGMTIGHPTCQRLHKDPRLGFHRERAGGLCYWKRSRQNVAGNLDLAAPRWTQHSCLWRRLRWRAVFFEVSQNWVVLPLKYTTTDFLTITQPHFMWQAGAVGLCPWLRSWLGHLDAVIH